MTLTMDAASRSAHVLAEDCRVSIRSMSDDSVDAVITDPPYDLTTGSRNGSPRQNDPGTPFGRTRLGGDRGFMGQTWDGSKIAFSPDFWREVRRVMRPGAYLAAFGSPRTWHRMVCALDDAGFEMYERNLAMVYASGFPKSLDAAKQIRRLDPRAAGLLALEAARKVAAVVVESGVELAEIDSRCGFSLSDYVAWARVREREARAVPLLTAGQWERVRLSLDPEALSELAQADMEELGALFEEEEGDLTVPACWAGTQAEMDALVRRWEGWGTALKPAWEPIVVVRKPSQDAGWAEDPFAGVDSLLRYVAKPSTAERNLFLADGLGRPVKNNHPTVKPLDLMRWLVRFLVPRGGCLLDPFLGSGTTAEAAVVEGAGFIGCEKTSEYLPIIEARLRRAHRGLSPGTGRFERARRAESVRRKVAGSGQLGMFEDGVAG